MPRKKAKEEDIPVYGPFTMGPDGRTCKILIQSVFLGVTLLVEYRCGGGLARFGSTISGYVVEEALHENQAAGRDCCP